MYAQDTWQVRPDVTINAGARYDYASLFGDYKKALAPRVGVSWDVGQKHQTIIKANYGLFFDRNLLSAASTVPDKGGVFTKSSFDVVLPRLGVDSATRSSTRHHVRFVRHRLSGHRRTRCITSRTDLGAIRSRSWPCSHQRDRSDEGQW